MSTYSLENTLKEKDMVTTVHTSDKSLYDSVLSNRSKSTQLIQVASTTEILLIITANILNPLKCQYAFSFPFLLWYPLDGTL